MPPSPRFAAPDIAVERRPDGVLLLRSRTALAPYPAHLGAILRDWAEREPERAFLAERGQDQIRRLSYGEAYQAARALATRMLDDGLGAGSLAPGSAVMVLSDNSIDHALVTLGALLAGVPVASVSPAYSLLSQDHAKLRSLHARLQPDWVFAEDGDAYARALAALPLAGARVVLARGASAVPLASTPLAALLDSPADTVRLAAAFDRIGPGSVAKILFTSGSTGAPKGVINTHAMLCSNQQALAQGWPFLRERPPVVVDWLPWSHTFGGNHNFNLVLLHGGTLWVDRGKPAPGRIEETVATLRLASPTVYFNVPRGFDALLPFLEADPDFAAHFFRDLDLLFYAAAALPRTTWERLTKLARQTRGAPVPFVSAWGATETSPMVTQVHFPNDEPGNIGVPAPGVILKLVPEGKAPGGERLESERFEVRVRGPQVTPGYYGEPERLATALDDEGFYCPGDAVRFADPANPDRGLVFAGRLSEDFKLTSGTWVHVGALRLGLIQACTPLVQDAVIAGHDRDAVAVLLFPDLAACARAIGAPPGSPASEVLADPRLRELVATALRAHNRAEHEASSRTVTAALLLAEPASIDAGEITDKGYLNQRAVLERRAERVARLYSGAPEVIRPEYGPRAPAGRAPRSIS